MNTFQKIVNQTSEWVGVVFSCVVIFFFLVQLILLINKF
jgi:hypothetical protein